MKRVLGVGLVLAVVGTAACSSGDGDAVSVGESAGASTTSSEDGDVESTGADEHGTEGEDAGTADTRGDTETGGQDSGGEVDVYAFANGCYSIADEAARWLVRDVPTGGFRFAQTDVLEAARFFMKASDLGSYLLYDEERGYVVAEDGPMLRQTFLLSDVLLVEDGYEPGAQWKLLAADSKAARFHLQHAKTQRFVGSDGLVSDEGQASTLRFLEAAGCAEHPELTLDAEGMVEARSFDDGSVWGIVDTHSHILSNFGFGGGGIFHGAPFHPLGVQHALPSCEQFHGTKGRKDFFGFGYDGGDLDVQTLVSLLIFGQLAEDNHETRGYPTFEDWPDAVRSSTHQTQYYLWLERAYMAGLRLVVQYATTNSVICEFMVGQDFQPTRYSCNDMVAVDRILEETRRMERYIDAQAGGPGRGFFRIVESPQEAREVIAAGKMAVVLGIETSNLFDCFSVPRPGFPECDADHVREQLDAYYERGVRVLFPVHKYDNAFTPGDGNRDFIELGNFINSGHDSNFTQENCPDVPAVFDRGDVAFGGLNRPRDEYLSAPPTSMAGFEDNPLLTLTPHLLRIQQGPLRGDYCQNAVLTELGETLLEEMMLRGMVIEIDHFARRSYQRAFEILEANDYPAAATHGSNYDGRLYALGGISKTSLGRCRDPERKGAMLDSLRSRVALIEAMGGYPAEGFGFDLNGFAGAPRPRFGEDSRCSAPQDDPITYPFVSYAGDVTFTEPRVGDRVIDFDTEGFVHIGMLPELLEDARRDAESDADLEPLFRSAEGYLRMWERSERRAAELRSARERNSRAK